MYFRFTSVQSPVVIVVEPLTAISLSKWSSIFFTLKYFLYLGQLAEQKVPSVLLVEGGLFKTVEGYVVSF